MLTCKHCGVDVRDDASACPLCQNALSGDRQGTGGIFPVIPTFTPLHQRLVRIFLFWNIAGCVICLAVNFIFPESGAWSLFVAAGTVSLWISLFFALQKRKNLPKNILWQVALLSAMSVVWDFATGFRGWSVDFVVPILCTTALAAMVLIARIIRLAIEDYILYLIIDSVFGIVPLVLLLTGVVSLPYPSVVCVTASLIFLAALMVFEGPALRAELRRRMHL